MSDQTQQAPADAPVDTPDGQDNDLHGNFDAQVWAERFVLRVTAKPSIATDEGTMCTWFAGALMTGYDRRDAQRAAENLAKEAETAKEPTGRLARVEVKGFRDLGLVHVSESTLAGEAMLRAESADGAVAEFPASSLHFITWLPDGAVEAEQQQKALEPFRPRLQSWDDDIESDYASDDEDEEHPFR